MHLNSRVARAGVVSDVEFSEEMATPPQMMSSATLGSAHRIMHGTR